MKGNDKVITTLNALLADELTAVNQYMVELADNGTRELLEATLKDEESHVDWLEAQIDQIQQMGVQNYLAEQTRE